MDSRKSIKRTYYCSLHTTKPVESVCIDSDTLKPLLCSECLADPDIHDPQYKNIVSLDVFFYQIEQSKIEQAKKGGFVRRMPKEIQALTESREEKESLFIQIMNKNREEIDELYNKLIQDMTIYIHKQKDRAFKQIDEQINLFKHNYTLFLKGAETLYPQEEIKVDDVKVDPFEEANQTIKVSDFEEIVNKYHEKYFGKDKKGDQKTTFKKKSLKNCGQQIDNCLTDPPLLRTDSYYKVLEGIEKSIAEVIDTQVKFNHPIKEVDFFLTTIDSHIINHEKEHNLIKSFFGDHYRYPRFELIYRASRDGYDCKDFHRCCVKQGPTLVLCSNDYSRRFGGYAQSDWNTTDIYSYGEHNFMFSIDNSEKYNIKSDTKSTAQKMPKHSGPWFGAGDLQLSSNFKHNTSKGKLGYSYYNYNNNHQFYNSRKVYDVFGNNTFKMKEVEVFRVIEGDDGDSLTILNKSMFSDFNGKHVKDQSTIINSDQFFQIIQWLKWYSHSAADFKVDLIYRASEHGYSAEDFHNRCDNRGATLTIMKSKGKGNIFGGYTSVSWKKTDEPVQDNSAFVFSVTKSKRYQLSKDEPAIFRASQSGPVFGNGDIFICSNPHITKDSYSNLGTSYNCGNLKNNDSFMAGEDKFYIDDIEVYTIK